MATSHLIVTCTWWSDGGEAPCVAAAAAAAAHMRLALGVPHTPSGDGAWRRCLADDAGADTGAGADAGVGALRLRWDEATVGAMKPLRWRGTGHGG